MLLVHDPEDLLRKLKDGEEYLLLLRHRGINGECFSWEGTGKILKPRISDEILGVEEETIRPLILSYTKMRPLTDFVRGRKEEK